MAEPKKAEAANAAPQGEQPAAQSEKPAGKPAAKTAPAAKAKAAGKPKEQVIKLYEAGKRIHPKKAEGRFAKLRIAAILATQFVFYCIPWFNWSGRQAVLFDIPNRHFFIFGLSFGMADLIYLALLLIISAFGLFWWTTVAGRLCLPADGLYRNHAVDRPFRRRRPQQAHEARQRAVESAQNPHQIH